MERVMKEVTKYKETKSQLKINDCVNWPNKYGGFPSEGIITKINGKFATVWQGGSGTQRVKLEECHCI